MSNQIKKQIIAALGSDKESTLVEKLLAKSKDNFQSQFKESKISNWIYADLEDLIRNSTASPKREWQGLTDEEIFDVIRSLCADNETAEMLIDISMDEYRAIEAKLKEKNT